MIYIITWFLIGIMFYISLCIYVYFKHKEKKFKIEVIPLIVFAICGLLGVFWTIEHQIDKKMKRIRNETKI